MRHSIKFILAALAAFAVFHLASPTAFAREDAQAVLTGTDLQPDATGLATYTASSGRGRGLEVTVEGVDLTDVVWVLVNGDVVSVITIVGTRGGGGIETRRGDDVPFIESGDLVEIADEDGNVLLSGIF